MKTHGHKTADSGQRAADKFRKLPIILCLVFGTSVLAPAQSPVSLTPDQPEPEKIYFGDQKGRFHLDVTGWAITPASASPDGLVHYRYQSGSEVSLVVTSDAKVSGNPLLDPADRADTLRQMVSSLGWADTKILKQQVMKVGNWQALDVVVIGSKKLRYKSRMVLIQQDDAVHQLCFTAPSSDYDWLRQPINRVIESFHAGKPPSPLMVKD